MEEAQARNGATVGAVGIAVVAILLGIFAVGTALSARNGTPGTTIGASAAA